MDERVLEQAKFDNKPKQVTLESLLSKLASLTVNDRGVGKERVEGEQENRREMALVHRREE